MNKSRQTSSLPSQDKQALLNKRRKIREVRAGFENVLSTYKRKQIRVIEELADTVDKRRIEKIKKIIGL